MLYFDHNATTPLDPQVAVAFAEASCEFFGNASSVHKHGQQARQHLEAARQTIAAALGASPSEFVFTGGGTESNNLALAGLLRSMPLESRHVITSAIEHPAVSEALRELTGEGVTITTVGVDSQGLVDPQEIASRLRPDTALVSVMHANNETGVLQPIAAISELVQRHRALGHQSYLHSDGVQSFGKIPVHVDNLGVDLYSISGHKLYAPKGVGGLYVRKGVPLRSLQLGGRHERGRRAGTENVAGAVAFARAVELCNSSEADRVRSLRDGFESHLLHSGIDVRRNGSLSTRLPSTSNLLFAGISAESLLISLDMQGMAVSTGSACSSGSVEPSHVLIQMGLSKEEARSSVRFSFGRFNTEADVAALAEAVIASVQRLRRSRNIRPSVSAAESLAHV